MKMKEFEPKMDSEGPPGSAPADALLVADGHEGKDF